MNSAVTVLFTKPLALTVPGHSMILTGTIPVKQRCVHWLSMGAFWE